MSDQEKDHSPCKFQFALTALEGESIEWLYKTLRKVVEKNGDNAHKARVTLEMLERFRHYTEQTHAVLHILEGMSTGCPIHDDLPSAIEEMMN